MSALFGYTGSPESSLLESMTTQLRHRGQGDRRVEQADHATLACLHPRSEGPSTPCRIHHEPATDQHAAVSLAYAGDLYGSPESLRSAQALTQAYLEHGLQFVHDLSGAFVIAIVTRDHVHLVRDPAGQRAIYYGRLNNRWHFAIEPKAITSLPNYSPKIRPAAIAQYLSFSFVPGEGTMLQDLFELQAGHTASIDLRSCPASITQCRYDHFERYESDPTERTDEEWTNVTRDTIRQAVIDRMPASEPVGVYLSGGLDSSLITAEVAALRNERVPTYAIHFGPNYPNELAFAREVADFCGTDHHEVLIRPKDFVPRLRKMVWHLDEPIGDPITTPNFELSSQVSRDLSFIYNGEGGDPLFGGPKNIPMLLHHWYGGIQRDARFREREYLASYRRAYQEVRHLLSPDMQRQVDEVADLESILTPFFTADEPSSFLNKLMAINIRLKGAHLILPKVERMTSASGITALSPLFDDRLINLSFQMPPKMKLRHGSEKFVFKQAYRDLLPESVLTRPKSGMRVPVYYWFTRELKRYARRILNPKEIKQAGIWNPDRVRSLLRYDTEEGPGRYGLRLWMLITFELWRRIVVEGEPV